MSTGKIICIAYSSWFFTGCHYFILKVIANPEMYTASNFEMSIFMFSLPPSSKHIRTEASCSSEYKM
jgi:hypothetical protein